MEQHEEIDRLRSALVDMYAAQQRMVSLVSALWLGMEQLIADSPRRDELRTLVASTADTEQARQATEAFLQRLGVPVPPSAGDRARR